MKFEQIEHYDYFDGDVVFWVMVKDIENKYVELAKEIDKENYSDECFGICINYDEETEKIEIVSDKSEDEQLYYIDNNGYKHWFECIVPDCLKSELKEICKKELGI